MGAAAISAPATEAAPVALEVHWGLLAPALGAAALLTLGAVAAAFLGATVAALLESDGTFFEAGALAAGAALALAEDPCCITRAHHMERYPVVQRVAY